MRRNVWRLLLAIVTVLAWSRPVAAAAPFTFVAYGDTGYYVPRDLPRVRALVAAINAERPAFAIHVGDIKGGNTPCSDADYRQRRDLLRLHRHPVVLTPGDNDWGDCGDKAAGSFDPLERLAALRKLFFSSDDPLGSNRLSLTRQSPAFPENARWVREGVMFATVHAIGPHNGLVVDQRRAREAIERSEAGKAWIEQAFEAARTNRAPALVIATQVNAWGTNTLFNAFDWLTATIRDQSRTFPGQVLIIHGDSHRLLIDIPYRSVDADRGSSKLHNVTRLMVPGSPDHRAVSISVDPARPAVFSFRVTMDPAESTGASE